jgi:hypothetical protein
MAFNVERVGRPNENAVRGSEGSEYWLVTSDQDERLKARFPTKDDADKYVAELERRRSELNDTSREGHWYTR